MVSIKQHVLLSNKLQVACNRWKNWSSLMSTHSNTELKRSFGQPTSFTHPYLMNEDEVTPGLNKQDYATRRQLLMKNLQEFSKSSQQTAGKPNVLILFGEPIVYMSEDIPYPFHQNPNFRYLTGFLEPDSCLIMEDDGQSSSYKSTLLVPERDEHKELWHGPRAGLDGALALTDVDATESFNKISTILPKYTSNDFNIWYDYQKPSNFHVYMSHMRKFLSDAFDKKLHINSPTNSIQKMRHVKNEKEIALMLEAGKITAEAYIRAFPACFSGMNEGVLHAMIECECKFKGAQMLAYPPVVAGGNRANTLHYICNNQRIEDGELVLVDAGAEYHGYVADVTRTWPINGRFTQPQRLVYEAVLTVQKSCIELCRTGTTLDAIHSFMCLHLCKVLHELGVVKTKPSKENTREIFEISQKFCPHHVGHWLGMDVHDTSSVPRSTALKPGMVVTIEPGIYIRSDDMDVPKEFRGIGIRIEDNVLITPEEPFVLSESCPKEADDIERLIASSS